MFWQSRYQAIDLGFPGFHHFPRVKKSTVILMCSSHLSRVSRSSAEINQSIPLHTRVGRRESRSIQGVKAVKAIKSGSQVITAVKSIEVFDQVCHIKQHSNESGHPATGAGDEVSRAVIKSSSFIQLPNWQRHQRVVQGPGSPRDFRL